MHEETMQETAVKVKERKRKLTWFRFYNEALDDPKVQRLTPTLFKTWVNLLCLASQADGSLPSSDDIAFRLRMSANDAASQIDELTLIGLIDITPDGKRTPHNWHGRQFASDHGDRTAADRMRRYRQRKSYRNDRNALHLVTALDTDTEAETDTDTEGEGPSEVFVTRKSDAQIALERDVMARLEADQKRRAKQ